MNRTARPWHPEFLVPLAIITVVVMMVVPLPWLLLDLLLALNLALAVTILLVTMYAGQPLEFSIFPALLLVATLFRLALNVSSTRLILLNGFAGRVIAAFGQFVVGGNPVVGFVVFLILVVIQFAVITRGAERVAEVAARFTLDAMPGKQMSIDADLNAGLLTEDEARKRRQEIEREADFYGAMDGASKFVKGDAIAGLIITIINLFGGVLTGMLQRGMDLAGAWDNYALLTVGDGLVSQLPALVISTATGIMVTRAASTGSLGADMLGQVLGEPKVLYLAGGVLAALALVPGLPTLPFGALALALLFMARKTAARQRQAGVEKERLEREQEMEAVRRPESVLELVQVDPLEIELGLNLLNLADASQGGDLLERVVMIRRQLALELGVVVPPIRVRDNIGRLEPSSYVIKLRGVEVGSGQLLPGHLLAMDPGSVSDVVQGIETTEPAFGLPARWIPEAERPHAELAGYTVVEPSAVLATHLSELLKRHGPELLTRQEVQNLVNLVKEKHPALVEELTPGLVSLGEIQKVLQNLLHEGVPIRDLVTIFEALADVARNSRDLASMTESVRQALARSITRQYGLDRKRTPVVVLDPAVEDRLLASIRDGRGPAGDARLVQELLANLGRELEGVTGRGHWPILLCSPLVRYYVKRLFERALPRLVVLSYDELDSRAQVESVGVVRAG
ncbi:MAG: flagellar biosynthesis protein FlhA [Bacillota bacterium]